MDSTEPPPGRNPDAASTSTLTLPATALSTQEVAAPRVLDSLRLDKRLRCLLSNEEELHKCQNLEPALEWSDAFAFPSPEELRTFAKAAYDKNNTEELVDWKLVMTAQSSVCAGMFESFFAKVYLKPEGNQLLVAIKGTTLTHLGDLFADVQNVLKCKGGLQVDSVFTFGEELRKLIEKFKCKPQVIITGHSLGGFLAQVLTFTLRNCGVNEEGQVVASINDDFGLNTYVFDSPAASMQILRIAKSIWDPLNFHRLLLPITNFIITPNLINSNSEIGPHLGILISLKNMNDINHPSKYQRIKSISFHSLKNFVKRLFDLEDASHVKHLKSAETEPFDPRRIPLLQFSQREQEALRLIPLTKTITSLSKDLVKSSSFTIQDNEVRLNEDQSETTFIPRMRFFVQRNKKMFTELADELDKQFRLLMESLLNAHAKDFIGLELRLKPELAKKFQEMASGSCILGLEDEREQMLFARTIKNSIDHFLFLRFDDFIGVDELQRGTWLQLNEGTLMLCQANGQRLDGRQDRKTKIFYIDSANAPKQLTPEDCNPHEQDVCTKEQVPLKVTDLDDGSRRKLAERKLDFFGNQIMAGNIFLGLFEDLKVKDVIDFNCQRKTQDLSFYFQQSFEKSQSRGNVTIGDLVSDIQKSYKSYMQRIFLISCNAGMGKSTNLKKVEKSLQENLPHFWVVRLELEPCSENIKKWTQILEQGKSQSRTNTAQRQESLGEDKISSVLNHSEQRSRISGPEVDHLTYFKEHAIAIIEDEIFKGTSKQNAELQRKVFHEKIRAKEVVFVMDAVDEVCPLYREATIELLRQLKETNLSILVATRPQEEKEVAQALGIEKGDILSLQIINNRDQAEFINQFWASMEISNGLKAAQSLLDQLGSHLPDEVPGVPLNLRMIAESFPDGKLSEEFLKHGDLYKTLFEISIREAIKNKFRQDYDIASQRNAHIKMAKEYFTLLQKIAVAEEFSEKISLPKDDVEFINRLPFAVVVDAEVRFTHKTFQEYLIAVQLVLVMNGDKDKKQVFLSENKGRAILAYKWSREIHSFFNTILIHTECSVSNARKFFSEEAALACLEEQHLRIFKLLCYDKSFCINRIGMDKRRPLEMILNSKKPKGEFVEYLISQGARLEDVVNEGNCDKQLRILIRIGVSKRMTEKWHLFESTLKNFDDNVLVIAAKCRNLELARFLIKRGACVEKYDRSEKHTPLSAAIENDDLEMVQLLLEHKARVSIEDFLKGGRACVKLLSEHITSINERDVNGKNLLMRAAEKGNDDCVRFLLDEGFDPKEKDREGRTCLYYAVKWNKYDLKGKQNKRLKILFELIAPSQEEKNSLLFVAVAVDEWGTLTFLIENGANPEAVDENGNTALHIAAGGEDSGDCIEVLLRGGADPNAKDGEGRTPLHHAAALSWSEESCKALLEAKAHVDSIDNKGTTPLMLAARSNKIVNEIEKVVEVLLENGADPSLQDHQGWNCLHHAADVGSGKAVPIMRDKVPIDSRCRGGLTPLMIAAKRDNSKAMEKLLENGADPSLVDEKGWNCLHHAAANGSDECVKILRIHVPLASKTVEGKTAFQLAEENCFKVMAQHLLREGVELDSSFNFKKLLENAIEVNNVETIEILLKNSNRVGAREFVLAAKCGHLNLLRMFLPLVESVDVKNKYEKSTALMMAAGKNNVECVQFLIEKGANPNEKDFRGGTSLHWAAWGGAAECFEMLFDLVANENRNLERILHSIARFGNLKTFLLVLGKGADLRVVDDEDNTCLHQAARNENPECLEYLLQNHLHQFDVNARNFLQLTALHCAVIFGGVPHVQLLMQNGAGATARDDYGRTALHWAAKYGRAENCEFMLKYIPVDSKDFEGNTPLMLAAKSDEEGARRVIKVLLDAGANPTVLDRDGRNSCIKITQKIFIIEI